MDLTELGKILVQVDGITFVMDRADAIELIERVGHALEALQGERDPDPADRLLIATGRRVERPRFSGAVRWSSPMPPPVVSVDETAPVTVPIAH